MSDLATPPGPIAPDAPGGRASPGSGRIDPAALEALGGLRRMNSDLPARKVTFATLAAAIVTIVAWLYEAQSGQALPAAVVGALTTIATFAVGYQVPPGRHEQVIRLDEPAGPQGRG